MCSSDLFRSKLLGNGPALLPDSHSQFVCLCEDVKQKDITRAIRAELDRFDKDVPLENVRTMSQLVSANVAQRRLSVQLLGGFAGSALLLSALGL